MSENNNTTPPSCWAWDGTGLPPIGAKVVLCGTGYVVSEPYKKMIGAEVVVVASFASPAGFDMIACALPDGLCGCFVAAMARPIRTPEQIATEERDAAINRMIGFVKDHPGGRHGVHHLAQLKIQEEACRDLYDAGYRKQA